MVQPGEAIHGWVSSGSNLCELIIRLVLIASQKFFIEVKIVLERVRRLLTAFGLRWALIAQLETWTLLELEVLVRRFFVLDDHLLLARQILGEEICFGLQVAVPRQLSNVHVLALIGFDDYVILQGRVHHVDSIGTI